MGRNTSLHPGFAVLVGYDNNIFNEDKTETPRGGVHLTPTGWVGIGNRAVRGGELDSPPKSTSRMVDYALRLQGGYRLYLSGAQEIRKASKLNVGAMARIRIAPGRRFTFDIEEDFARLGEPPNFETSTNFSFSRIDHKGALRFTLRPGGGRLALSAAYLNQILRYESTDIVNADRIVNGAEQETSYRIRDRSALVLRYQFLQTYYTCCTLAGSGRNEDSRAHRIAGGFVGQVGKKWILEALVGYDHLTYVNDVNGPSARQVTGRAAVSYFPTLRTELRLQGFRRTSDALFGNYFIDVGADLFASHLFWTRTKVTIGASLIGRRTGGLPVPGVETSSIVGYQNAPGNSRRDTLFSAYLQAEQALGRFFVVALRYNVAANSSDFAVEYENGTLDRAAFARHQIMLIGAVRY